MSRIRFWLKIYQGRRVRLFIILYFFLGAYDFIGSQFFRDRLPTVVNLLPDWNFTFWIIIGILILWLIALEDTFQTFKNNAGSNWIERHKLRTGHLPLIPQYLSPVIQNYTPNQPITKDIKVITPSGQFWNSLLPSQQEDLVSLIEWLGLNSRDYLAQMRRMLPTNPNNKIQLKWKK